MRACEMYTRDGRRGESERRESEPLLHGEEEENGNDDVERRQHEHADEEEMEWADGRKDDDEEEEEEKSGNADEKMLRKCESLWRVLRILLRDVWSAGDDCHVDEMDDEDERRRWRRRRRADLRIAVTLLVLVGAAVPVYLSPRLPCPAEPAGDRHSTRTTSSEAEAALARSVIDSAWFQPLCGNVRVYMYAAFAAAVLALIGRALLLGSVIGVSATVASRRAPWFFPLLLCIAAGVTEALGTEVGDIIGTFYSSLIAQPAAISLFVETVWRSIVLSGAIAGYKGLLAFAADSCALQWRRAIVDCVQRAYFRPKVGYMVMRGYKMGKTGAGGAGTESAAQRHHKIRNRCGRRCASDDKRCRQERVDTPDERATRDALLLCDALADIASKLAALPVLMIYYTQYLCRHYSPLLPLFSLCYGLFGGIVQTLLARRIVPLVYLQERFEGRFRYVHALHRARVEQVELLQGAHAERRRADRAFAHVVANKQRLIVRRLPLSFSTNFIDYLGSAVNYASVGAAILWLGNTDGLSPSQIAFRVSKVRP